MPRTKMMVGLLAISFWESEAGEEDMSQEYTSRFYYRSASLLCACFAMYFFCYVFLLLCFSKVGEASEAKTVVDIPMSLRLIHMHGNKGACHDSLDACVVQR